MMGAVKKGKGVVWVIYTYIYIYRCIRYIGGEILPLVFWDNCCHILGLLSWFMAFAQKHTSGDVHLLLG